MFSFENLICVNYMVTFNSKKRKSTPTRYSILSDPRLSQLFALSSQLEALADSIDVAAPSQNVENDGGMFVSNVKQGIHFNFPKSY